MCSVQSVFYSLDSFFVVGFGHATVRCDNHQVQYDTNQNETLWVSALDNLIINYNRSFHKLHKSKCELQRGDTQQQHGTAGALLCVCGTSRVLLNQLEDIVGWVQAVALGTLPTVQP